MHKLSVLDSKSTKLSSSNLLMVVKLVRSFQMKVLSKLLSYLEALEPLHSGYM